MEEILRKTLDLIYSVKRPMPAHFTSYGKRKQSFCIDFEPLTQDDDYNMASESYYSISDYITEKSNLSEKQCIVIRMCAEDIMVGSYIITKLGRKDLIQEMKEIILKHMVETFPPVVGDLKEILYLEEPIKYYNHCAEYAIKQAENSIEDESS